MAMPRWRRWLAQALSFGWNDWWFLIQAYPTLGWAEIAIRVRPTSRVLTWASVVRPDRHRTLTEPEILRCVWLLNVAADVHVVRMRCLTRSMALARLLGRRGVATQLRVGVATAEGRLAAHAWVEWNGRPITDDAAVHDRFAAFDRPARKVTPAP